MKKLFTLIMGWLLCLTANAQGIELPLWPNGAPTDNGLTGEEQPINGNMVTNVSKPTITVYKAQKPNGKCIIACPGGGYFLLAIDHEGKDMADWFNSLGITYVVLKYRMPNAHYQVPLEDGEQAIRMVRQHAAEWGINPNQVGIMGSSAGGHFAATLSTLYTSRETRPDFSVLFYPVISMQEGVTHQGSRDLLLGKNPSADLVKRYDLHQQVNAQTPPAFLMLSADDDAVPPVNSLNYFNALLQNGVKKCAMHIYPTGGHGWGFGDNFIYKRQWTEELEHWLFTLFD